MSNQKPEGKDQKTSLDKTQVSNAKAVMPICHCWVQL
jgi:hypothetical protein